MREMDLADGQTFRRRVARDLVRARIEPVDRARRRRIIRPCASFTTALTVSLDRPSAVV